MACGVCGSEDATRPLCASCTGTLERYLAETDALCGELEVTITRQAKTRTAGSTTTEKPVPFNVEASTAKGVLRMTLKGFAAYVAERRLAEGVTVKLPTPATAENCATVLLNHVDWISRRDEAPEIHRAVEQAVRDATRAIDNAPDTITLGVCGGDDGECTAPLRAIHGHHQTTCHTCGTVWDVNERRDWLLTQAGHYHVTPAEASRIIPDLTPQRIKKWSQRGHVTRYDGRYVLAHLHRLTRLKATGSRLSHIDKETQ